MRPTFFYILDAEGNPQPSGMYTWGRWFNTADRTLAQDTVGALWVSTIFLGLDHNHGDGPPILYETLAFAPNDEGERVAVDGSMQRYETKEQALAGHAEVVNFLRLMEES